VIELTLNGVPVASGLVMRQRDRAFFFKIAYDETMGRVSPGVQLTLELTKRFAEDESIALVDSTANAGHPMIDHVWRERLDVADRLIRIGSDGRAAFAIACKLESLLRTAVTLAKRVRDMIRRVTA
jgi:hypothetical protein